MSPQIIIKKLFHPPIFRWPVLYRYQKTIELTGSTLVGHLDVLPDAGTRVSAECLGRGLELALPLLLAGLDYRLQQGILGGVS